MTIEDLVQQKTSQAAEMNGAELTVEELDELAQIVWEMLKQELMEESARIGKLI